MPSASSNLCFLVEWPCALWTLFNENLNYVRRMPELAALRDEERPLVNLGAACEEQSRSGRLFLGENPLRSRLWREDSVQKLLDLPDCRTVTCDAGAYGAEMVKGEPIVKTHRWMTNSDL